MSHYTQGGRCGMPKGMLVRVKCRFDNVGYYGIVLEEVLSKSQGIWCYKVHYILKEDSSGFQNSASYHMVPRKFVEPKEEERQPLLERLKFMIDKILIEGPTDRRYKMKGRYKRALRLLGVKECETI